MSRTPMNPRKALAVSLAALFSTSALFAGATSPAAADPPTDEHIPATLLPRSAGCPVPARANKTILVWIEGVLDRNRASRKVRIATYEAAWVESHVNNLRCGDGDSVGVFQQRPSMGWTHALRPRKATYDFLHGNPSDNTPGAIRLARAHPKWSAGRVAQGVQRSAYPDRYNQARGKALRLMKRANQLQQAAATSE